LISLGKQPVTDQKSASFLVGDEKLILSARIHPAIYWKGVAIGLFALFLLVPAFNLGIFFLFVAGVMIVLAAMTKGVILLTLTDKRVLVRTGIVFMEMIQLRHSQIESAEVSWTVPGRMFGYASIIISGTGQRRLIIPYVADPMIFRQALEAALLAREDSV